MLYYGHSPLNALNFHFTVIRLSCVIISFDTDIHVCLFVVSGLNCEHRHGIKMTKIVFFLPLLRSAHARLGRLCENMTVPRLL